MKHNMVLEKTYESGNETWVCNDCGRKLMITWEPFEVTTIDSGNDNISHSISKGGLQINSVERGE